MKWKNRLKNYNFWISIVSAVLLILQAFHINFDIAYINEIATAVLGLLVVIGIINDPTKTVVSSTEKKDVNNIVETNKIEVLEENKETMQDVKNEEETQIIPSDVENEVANNNSEIDFKAVIELLSSEIKKAVKDVGLVNEEISNKDKNKTISVGENFVNSEENLIENNKENKIDENQSCYNIVN